MELIKLECPYCGAELNVKSDTRECFCTYCGKKLLIKDDVHRSEVSANINYKDMARLKELEMLERELAKKEEQERLEAQATANYYARVRRRLKRWFLFSAIISFLVGIFSAAGTIANVKNIENIYFIVIFSLLLLLSLIVLFSVPNLSSKDDSKNNSSYAIVFLAALPTFAVKLITEYIVKSLFF